MGLSSTATYRALLRDGKAPLFVVVYYASGRWWAKDSVDTAEYAESERARLEERGWPTKVVPFEDFQAAMNAL